MLGISELHLRTVDTAMAVVEVTLIEAFTVVSRSYCLLTYEAGGPERKVVRGDSVFTATDHFARSSHARPAPRRVSVLLAVRWRPAPSRGGPGRRARTPQSARSPRHRRCLPIHPPPHHQIRTAGASQGDVRFSDSTKNAR